MLGHAHISGSSGICQPANKCLQSFTYTRSCSFMSCTLMKYHKRRQIRIKHCTHAVHPTTSEQVWMRERGRVRARPHEGEATNSRCVACTQRVNFPVESGSTSNINIATPTRILLLPPLLPLLLLFIFSAPVTRAFVRPTHYENQRTLAAMLCAYE